MDGFEINKIFGAFIGACMVFVAIEIVTSGVFGQKGHHGEEKLAFAIPVDGAETAAPAEEKQVEPIAVRLASADPAAGEKVFKKCQACHVVEKGGANKTGPALYGVVGRQIAAVDGFRYGGLGDKSAEQWTFEALDGFLEAPKKWAPGTTMAFRGLAKPADRAAIIAYLNAQSDSPVPVPAAE